MVDDDSLIVESLKLILPKHWKMTAVTKPELLDSKMLVHAAFVDMHLKKDSKIAEGPEVIRKLSKENPTAMVGDDPSRERKTPVECASESVVSDTVTRSSISTGMSVRTWRRPRTWNTTRRIERTAISAPAT